MSWDLEDDDAKSKETQAEQDGEQDAEETTEEQPPEDENLMEQALKEAAPRTVEKGEIIEGIVAYVGDQYITVDVGHKYEGLVPTAEFSEDEMPEIEDKIEVAVVGIDDKNGRIKLSKRRADYERTWRRLLAAVESGEILEGMVTERVKGGLRVDVGVPAFIPGSHMATRNLRNLERFVGQSLRLKIIEAERQSKKVICSHRLVVEEERKKRKEETLNSLEEGMVCEGKVRNLTNYGAFVNLGGVDGLLHVSEISWTRVEDPADVLSVGDTLKVAVLEIDRERERISLSRRQILPDPWKQIAKELHPGSLVDAKITRIVKTGAFAQLPDHDVEGFLPISELSERHVSQVSEVISEGETLELKVTELRPSARRMSLSLVGAVEQKEREEVQEYLENQETETRTLGDQFGDLLQDAVAEGEFETAQEGEQAREPETTEEEKSSDVQDEAAEEEVAEEEVAEEEVAEEEAAEEASEQQAPEAEETEEKAAEATEEEAEKEGSEGAEAEEK
ncbi:MAG: S1 RNA-binding domain-containing protein [Armatimonadota bacterium]